MSTLALPAEIPDDDHPGVLLARAHELYNEAEELAAQAQAKRVEASKMRARAERLRDGEHLRPVRMKPSPPDPLTAAAGLAIDDLGGAVAPAELAELLEITEQRAVKILCGLVELGSVTRLGDGRYRAYDEEEPKVRDALRELGTCTREELAAHMDVPVAYLTHYLEKGRESGWCSVSHDDHLMYLRVEPGTGPREHETKRPPEKDPPAYGDAPHRGTPVRIVNHGDRGTRAGQANRHQIKQRDKRHARMVEARSERSQRGKAKAAAEGDKPSGYNGKRNPRRKTKKKK